jgi:hypothetical protein
VTNRSKASRSAASPNPDDGNAELGRALGNLHRALFRYPMAAQAAFSALVAEGRRFAKTPEGADWQKRLLSARETGSAQLLWEILSSRTFTERSEGALPSTLLDALSRAIRIKSVEPLLARILERR